MGVQRQAFVTPGQGQTERTAIVLSIIGSACEAMCSGPAIGPTTISLPLGAMGAMTLRKLAFRIAERYNLVVDVDTEGSRAVIRLRRPATDGDRHHTLRSAEHRRLSLALHRSPREE